MAISKAMAKFLITKWLERCVCENENHPVQDARLRPAYLFLRPAINDTLKSDLSYLMEMTGSTISAEKFQKNLEQLVIGGSGKYNYSPLAPFMCGECASKAGLEVHEDWRVVSEPKQRCQKCGNIWDPWGDTSLGAVCTHDNGTTLCLSCFLKSNQEKDVKMKSNLSKNKTERQLKDHQRREENDRMLEGKLTDSVCSECGETDISKLLVITGPKSPPGKPWQWRRDDTNDAFRKKLTTTTVCCKVCQRGKE